MSAEPDETGGTTARIVSDPTEALEHWKAAYPGEWAPDVTDQQQRNALMLWDCTGDGADRVREWITGLTWPV